MDTFHVCFFNLKNCENIKKIIEEILNIKNSFIYLENIDEKRDFRSEYIIDVENKEESILNIYYYRNNKDDLYIDIICPKNVDRRITDILLKYGCIEY